MANEIKAKYSGKASLTLTAASLASSTSRVGRQTTMVDNTTDRFKVIHGFAKITVGTTPVAGRGIYLHLIKGNDPAASTYRTDGAGASDAALTVVNAPSLGGAVVDATNDKTYYIDFTIHNPGPEWGVAVHHDTNVNLNATGSNHAITWVGETDEVQ